MRMRGRFPGRAGRRLLLIGSALWPVAASAQLMRVGTNGGEFGVENRSERTLGGSGAPSTSALFTEWVALQLQGTLGSPNLVNYAVDLRPTWGQQRVTRTAALRLNGLGASVSVNLLPASPFPIAVRSERSSGSVRGEFGSQTQYRLSSAGASLRLQNRAFPILLDYSTRRSLSDWSSAFSAPVVRRDEDWRTLRLSGQSSKLSAILERTTLIDGLGAQGYTLTNAQGSHVLRWGKGSTLETFADAQWRAGHDPQRRRLLSASLRLHHTETMSTALAVQQQVVRAPTFSANTRGGNYTFAYDGPGWFGASLDAAGAMSVYHNGRSSVLQVTPTVRMHATLPLGGRLTGAVFAGAMQRSQDFFGESWLVVADERHQATQAREFVLAMERVDSASVKLVSEDRALTYMDGFDYRLVRLGDQMRVVIPLSSRIGTAETVLVSYRYLLPPVPGIRTRSAGADAAIAFDGFSLQHSARWRRSAASDGSDNDQLDSADEFTTIATLRHGVWRGRVQGDVTHRVRLHSPSDFESTELRASLASPIGYALQATIGASGTQTRMSGSNTRLLTSSAAVGWILSNTFQLHASAESWLWSFRHLSRERLLNLNLEVAWSFGALETEWRYAIQRRSSATVGEQHQFFGRVKRRF